MSRAVEILGRMEDALLGMIGAVFYRAVRVGRVKWRGVRRTKPIARFAPFEAQGKRDDTFFGMEEKRDSSLRRLRSE